MTLPWTKGWCVLALVFSLVSKAIAASSPPEQVVREFYAYLAASDHRTTAGVDNHWVEAPNIRDDTSAQECWLSRALRESLRRANASIRRRHPRVDQIPVREFDSGSFRFGWDPPERFVVKQTTRAPFTAVVAGVMIWEPDQQYAGNRRNAFFILVAEKGVWRVDDIQVEPYEFDQSTGSLRAQLASYW